jgi:cystathionine beta-lyase family protein involved in aluminum resistance
VVVRQRQTTRFSDPGIGSTGGSTLLAKLSL